MDGFLFDTHIHTAESSPCGVLSAEETVRAYHAAGYSGLCITDHYNAPYFAQWGCPTWNETADRLLLGYRRAAECGAKLGMDILLGTEIRFVGSPNDFLLFGLTEAFFYEYPNVHTYAPEEFCRLMNARGVLVFQAHPFRTMCSVAEPIMPDGIEVINGNPRHNSWNEKAAAYARAHGLYVSAGSDCHQIEDVGQNGIITNTRIWDLDQLIDALKSPETRLYTATEGQ